MEAASPVVLVLDDDVTLSELLGFWIERGGLTPVCVTDLDTALEVQRQQPVDAMITDYELGSGITGIDAAHALSKSAPDLPIVVMSGYREDQLELGDLTGRIKFFQKPFQPDSLVEHLKSVVA